MSANYPRPELSAEDRKALKRVYDDLLALSSSEVPAVAAAARAALAQVATALNGQGLTYELYSNRWNGVVRLATRSSKGSLRTPMSVSGGPARRRHAATAAFLLVPPLRATSTS